MQISEIDKKIFDLSHTKWSCLGIWNFDKVKVGGLKCIQVHSKSRGTFGEKVDNLSLNPILSTVFTLLLSRNYVFREDLSLSDYSQLFWTCRASTICDLPINL